MRCISNFTSTYVFIYGMTQSALKKENSAAKHMHLIPQWLESILLEVFFSISHMITNCTFFDMCNRKILFLEFFILLSFVLIVFPGCCKNVTHHSSRWRSLVSRVLKSVSKVSVVRPRLTLLGNFFLLNFTLGINNGLFNKRLSKRKLLESTPLFRNLESLKKCEQILP